MSEPGDAGERYALLGWFARDVTVGAGAVCRRCTATDQFAAAQVVQQGESGHDVVARAGETLDGEGVRDTVERAFRKDTVQVHGERAIAAIPVEGEDTVLVLKTNWEGEVDRRDRSFLRELGRAVSPALDQSDALAESRRPAGEDERRQKLQALQATAERLVRAESREEIARVAVVTAHDVLDCPITGIWFYDEDEDVLEPAAVTDEGRELLGEPVSFERGEGLAWRAFETGEIGLYDDVGTVEGAYNPSTPVRSEIDVPIGRHGVLTTATTRHAEFTEVDLDLLRILASNTEAVLDRAERESESMRYEKMVEAANDPIWAVDTQGRITQVNERAVELADHDRETLVGAPVSLVFSDDLIERAWEKIRDLRERDDDSATYQETFQLARGETREYRVSLSLLHDGGAFVGTVFVAHDVTALRRHEQLLSVFNRVLRHNLRNQLTVILGYVADLAESDDDSVAVPAEQALAAARNLRSLSEKTQRFQSITRPDVAGGTTIDVVEKIERAVERVREEYPDATIRVTHPGTVRARAHGALEFAIQELVENAIQHADGAPEVEVAAGVSEDGETVEVRVADNGPGLPEMERQVFEQDLETPLQHASGLGLWMVRWTADTSGGATEIHENDPRGTVVVLRLPQSSDPAE